MNSTLKRDLTAVRDYLDDPKRWTQGKMFGNRKGEGVSRRDATCACLLGTIMLVTDGRASLEKAERYDAVEEALRLQLPPEFCSLPKFNDAASYAQVLVLVDQALEQ